VGHPIGEEKWKKKKNTEAFPGWVPPPENTRVAKTIMGISGGKKEKNRDTRR